VFVLSASVELDIYKDIIQKLPLSEAPIARQEAGYMQKILDQVTDVKPMSPSQYRQHLEDASFDWHQTLIFCTSREAKELLSEVPLIVPLLVQSEMNDSPAPRNTLSIQHFLEKIEARNEDKLIDVHDFQSATTTMLVEDAFKRLQSSTTPPINMLSIDAMRDNSTPWELEGLEDFTLLSDLPKYAAQANRQRPETDLSTKRSWSILGQEGIWSFPHVDEHGMYTAALCEEGKKIWISWNLTKQEREDWARRCNDPDVREHAPRVSGYPILMSKGDLLIQPPGTVHAPVSRTNVAMSGWFGWNSKTMLRTAESALLDLRYDQITNEEPKKELVRKLNHIGNLWRERRRPWTWGPEEELAKYLAVVQVSSISGRRCCAGLTR
jgi:hypothetical protein